VLRADRAVTLGTGSLLDLAGQSGELTIGTEVNFQASPLGGLRPLARRCGMSFGAVQVVTSGQREALYPLRLVVAQEIGAMEIVMAAHGEAAEGGCRSARFAVPGPALGAAC